MSSLINPDLKDDGGDASHNTVTAPALHVTRHALLTRHASHVTRHASHITCHTSHVTRQVAYEARLLKRMFLKLQD